MLPMGEKVDLVERAALVEKVIEMIPAGMSVKKACETVGLERAAFHRFINESPDHMNEYIRAGRMRADGEVEEIIDIADDPEIDAHRARNMIDARKHYAACMVPERYGNRLDVNLTQVVDLSKALTEANARVQSLPIRSLELPSAKQVIDVTSETQRTATGSQPSAVPETGDAGESETPSIFD